MTDKSVNSEEYQFVKNYDLPDKVVKGINLSHAKRKIAGKGGLWLVLAIAALLVFSLA